MKFAHLADCHIGSWRNPEIAELNILAFETAIDFCVDKKIDFMLISGDLFNTSLPAIDALKRTTKKLSKLRKNSIPVYMIAGSHDFSSSGKSMLDVLENAGLVINVARAETIDDKINLKFTVDKKTGAKITGLLGKKGGLEREYYESLVREDLESGEGYKIFLFHTLLTELKPKKLEKADSQPLSLLPKNFDYYAGGHPHYVFSEKIDEYGIISYPGPLFPNNFKELEELGQGGFFIVEDNSCEWISVKIKDTENIHIDAEHKTVEQLHDSLQEQINKKDMADKIITIRIAGILESGKPSDIKFSAFYSQMKEKGTYSVLRNFSALSSKEFQDIKVEITNTEELEKNLIGEEIGEGDLSSKDAKELTRELMEALDDFKKEGEKVYDFEKRIIETADYVVKDDNHE